jgi:HlyD family secretion protein
MNMRRSIIIPIAVAVISGALAWALWPRPVEVETATIGPRDIAVTLEEEGKTRVREVFIVSAPVAGRMTRLDLHPGDAVKANETVVALMRSSAPELLDTRSRRIAQFRVDAAIAAVDLANAELSQSEAQAVFLRAELERANVLSQRGALAARMLDKARLDLATAEAAIASARANLAVRRQELESAKAQLIEVEDPDPEGGCCVRVFAPVSGKVLKVLAESEQVVSAGTPVAELGDPHDIEVVADLLSRDAVIVAPGDKATIRAWGGEPLEAVVERVEPSAFTKVSALGIEEQRVSVILRPASGEAGWTKLGHGFRVVAEIEIARRQQVPAIALGALFRSGGEWAAYTVRNGRAELAPLRIGERNGEFAEVLGGLASGEAVILHPGDRITEGVRVSMTPGGVAPMADD